jgi:hypothetical protein
MQKTALNIIAGCILLLLTLWLGTMIFFNSNHTLIYLNEPGSGQEKLIRSNLKGKQNILLEDFGSLLEMSPSPDGKWLGMITEAKDGTEAVQIFSMDQNKFQQSYSCKSALCNALFWQADSGVVYFHLSNSSDGNSTHQIFSLDVKNGQTIPLSFKEGVIPLTFSLSPESRYQAVYDDARKGFSILDDGQNELVLIQSQDASAVLWQSNPARVSVITSENLDKIPVSHIVEVNLETLTSRYMKDASIENMDYRTLIQHPKEDTLIFGCRPVLRTLSRQICSASLKEFVVEQRTDFPSRNHAAAVISPDGQYLAYQTLNPASSSAKPAVWVMDWATGNSTLLAENAAMPQWIP